MSRFLLLFAILALTCCAPPIVSAGSDGCSKLVPQSWKQGVAGAPLPGDNTVAELQVFGDAQTGKLDQANGRTTDSIEIVERCEARDAAALKRARRGFLGRIFG